MKKLHIGCGKCYIPGWVNLDLFSSVKADMYADMAALPFEPRSFSTIYCSHLLEHSQRHTIIATLSHWRNLLELGGILRLAVPNFEAICSYYTKTGDLPSVMGLLFGGQNHPRNNHFITFDKKYLTELLIKSGFVDVKEWDWRTTEHAQFDDYSQAYLPAFDRENGQLMSLNIQATRP